jgi:hypothetical protein
MHAAGIPSSLFLLLHQCNAQLLSDHNIDETEYSFVTTTIHLCHLAICRSARRKVIINCPVELMALTKLDSTIYFLLPPTYTAQARA